MKIVELLNRSANRQRHMKLTDKVAMKQTKFITCGRTSETNLRNLEQLKEYAYDYEYRLSPKSNKPIIVYICRHENCDKEFIRTWNLLDHVRMHRGVQPYVCHFCSKTFTQKCNYRKHVYRHNNPVLESRRRYSCRFCCSRFTERYNYKTHLRRKHDIRDVTNDSL